MFVHVSDTDVISQPSEESEETLSPSKDGTFSYGAPSEPLGSDIKPLIRVQSTQFFQNLDQLDISAAVAGTAIQSDPGLGAIPRTSDIPLDASSPPTAGPSQPSPCNFRDFFDIKPDAPVFKVPCLLPPKTYVIEMSATRTNVTLRHTSHP